ncbi:pyridoxal-phosphate dependent enzyme [Coniella lustricola]|uniref:Pyridoxal-phosphate dependent enzyme n=1 Tax=Coniella lustricola TaxID=2025994 RepID=A0A2T3A9M3_9PEZI|nr:pyridoxal-phosphate dependent enzyme [Coniella lustricola]
MADSTTTTPPLTRASVIAAHELIKPYIHRTPVLTNTTLNKLASSARSEEELAGTRWRGREQPGVDGSKVREEGEKEDGRRQKGGAKPVMRLWFKCENLQRIGAFKVRGAFHAVERLKMDREWVDGGGLERGVLTHSSGNHAQAVALAAKENNMPAYIIMPEISAPPKIAGTKGYGAHVIFSGSTAPEREATAHKVLAETGATFIPPYDHPNIILGQGTMGLEFQEQVVQLMAEKAGSGNADRSNSNSNHDNKNTAKGLDVIMTPCGGGGMLSGVALSCEGTGITVFGSEPSHQGADDCKRGFEAGQRVESVSSLTIADGLRTPVGKLPWSVIYERRLVKQVFNVTEEEITAALRLVLERMKLVVEPSAVVPLAVALFNEDFREMVEREAGDDGWDIGLVFSGGNVALENLAKMFG